MKKKNQSMQYCLFLKRGKQLDRDASLWKIFVCLQQTHTHFCTPLWISECSAAAVQMSSTVDTLGAAQPTQPEVIQEIES